MSSVRGRTYVDDKYDLIWKGKNNLHTEFASYMAYCVLLFTVFFIGFQWC